MTKKKKSKCCGGDAVKRVWSMRSSGLIHKESRSSLRERTVCSTSFVQRQTFNKIMRWRTADNCWMQVSQEKDWKFKFLSCIMMMRKCISPITLVSPARSLTGAPEYPSTEREKPRQFWKKREVRGGLHQQYQHPLFVWNKAKQKKSQVLN